MKIRINTILCLLITLVLVLAFPVQAAAEADSMPAMAAEVSFSTLPIVISPMMVYIYRTTTLLSINASGYATANGSIIGYQGVTEEVWIYLYLERYVNGTWQIYRNWTQTFDNYYGYLQGTATVPSGYYYRVRGSYYGWSGTSYDHVTGYSGTIYY